MEDSVLEAFYYDFAIHSRRYPEPVFFVIDETGGVLEAGSLTEMKFMLNQILGSK